MSQDIHDRGAHSDGEARNPLPAGKAASPGDAAEVITLGGGCFWCLEAIYERMRGVHQVISGYSGGSLSHPTYAQVCRGDTGHAEAVQITFDPREIDLKELLEIFFTIHDPTTPDRQGADIGPQYRSVIFYRDEAQRRTAQEVMREVERSGIWPDPLATELVEFEEFFPAEEDHQLYFDRNPGQPYCRVVIAPKVAAFQAEHAGKLKFEP
ncbi:MAG: peptide-methionine (S)-S-oxide reductase MsrA [Candidatus Eisenbacteria bacterium]|nr:peptide-methionine (S)-S-oxide reductase MsrA [Candidatus Eisenbacteria bacterium]